MSERVSPQTVKPCIREKSPGHPLKTQILGLTPGLLNLTGAQQPPSHCPDFVILKNIKLVEKSKAKYKEPLDGLHLDSPMVNILAHFRSSFFLIHPLLGRQPIRMREGPFPHNHNAVIIAQSSNVESVMVSNIETGVKFSMVYSTSFLALYFCNPGSNHGPCFIYIS